MTRRKSGKKTPAKPKEPKARNPMARELGRGLYGQRVVKKPSKRQLQQAQRLKEREAREAED